MLKITGSIDKPTPSKNNNNRSASKKNDGNSKVDKFGGNSVEHAKKSRKSKGQKSAKFQKLSKSRKPKRENWNNCQKIRIYLISILWRPDQAF